MVNARAALVVACLGVLMPRTGAGQGLVEVCSAQSSTYCARTAEAAEVVLVRSAVAAASGNPVAGTASTIGMRIGATPRVTITGRWTFARGEVPRLRSSSDADEHTLAMSALGIDASVGLFDGVTLGPTVGGFGSVDLLASIVGVGLPDADEWSGDRIHSWGIGVRLGILRESFTAPGLSLSLMRRGFGRIWHGDPDVLAEVRNEVGFTVAAQQVPAHVQLDDVASWSVRAAVGKRFAGIGFNGGIGWDRTSADVSMRIQEATAQDFRDDDFDTSRFTLWGDAAYTRLVFSLVAGAGWQSGGDGDDYVSRGGLYGTLALRLSI